jgi:SpoVK/Ycf46/Vps4 family AAA+-type ATPase
MLVNNLKRAVRLKTRVWRAGIALHGPSGTGNTAFADQLVRAVDCLLLVTRSYDLLSEWVGKTCAQITDDFAEVRRRDEVLLFDKADSLLIDCSTRWSTQSRLPAGESQSIGSDVTSTSGIDDLLEGWLAEETRRR